MENKEKQLVVVLSRNYSTGLSIIKSLGTAGYTVDYIASVKKKGTSAIAACSKYVRNAVEVVSRRANDGKDEELLEELLKYAEESDQKIVLIPTDDYSVSVMEVNREQLEKCFVMPTITGDENKTLLDYMDKSLQAKIARKAGILAPQDWVISLEDEIVIPDDMVYPCFCKPLESVKGYRKQMAVCNEEEELMKHLKRLQRVSASKSILVQEFLEIDYEIDLSGVCLDQEVIIPAIVKKTYVAEHEKGLTLAGKLLPYEEMGDVQQKIIEMLKSLHYVGMFDMEFTVVGDKIYFNEINFRGSGPNYAYLKCGVNLPDLFVKSVLGEEHDSKEECIKKYGKVFINEMVAWKDYNNGFMTKKELDKCLAKADIKLFCDSKDPEPGKMFKAKFKKVVLKRRAKRAKKIIRKIIHPVVMKLKPIILRFPQTKRKNRRNPNSEKPRVIITGRNYCSNLCLARGFGQAGYEVEILRIFQKKPKRTNFMKLLKPDAYSEYVKAYHVCITRNRNKKAVRKLISLADPNRKMLLIPADDLMACTVDDNLDKLREYYLIPNVDDKAGEISRLMSKDVQKELALKAGLPVVNSCVIRTIEGEFTIPETVTYPCFMKPNISKNGSKTKMRRCDNEEELSEAMAELCKKKDVEMLIEDFVDIGKEYSILGVSTKEGAIGPGFFGAEEGGQNEHRGIALIGKTVPCSQRQELIDQMVEFVGSLKFDGLYDIDLIETKDGKMYFVELNLRFGGSGYAITASGVNLPGMFADYMLLNKPIDKNCKLENTGKRFLSEKIMIEEYVKGRVTKEKINSSMEEVDIHFIKDDKDKRPYRHFRKFYFIAAIRRNMYLKKEAKKLAAEQLAAENQTAV